MKSSLLTVYIFKTSWLFFFSFKEIAGELSKGFWIRMGKRLEYFTSQDVLDLLLNSFAIPKHQYLMKTATCFKSINLQAYNNSFHEILCSGQYQPGPPSPSLAMGNSTCEARGTWSKSAVRTAPSAFLSCHCRPGQQHPAFHYHLYWMKPSLSGQ